jgi:PAS domain S-box-containing protein
MPTIENPKRAEHDLRRSEERLRQQAELLELAHDAIFIWDRDRRITFWNEGAVETYGFSKDEALGADVRALLQTEFPAPLAQIEEALARDGRWQGELFHRRKDGWRIAVESRWRLFGGVHADALSVIEVCRDVSARRAAEQAIRTSEQRFRTMADAAPVMIWMSAADTTRSYFNRGWLNFTGRSLEQEVGDGWAANVHPQDLARCQQM